MVYLPVCHYPNQLRYEGAAAITSCNWQCRWICGCLDLSLKSKKSNKKIFIQAQTSGAQGLLSVLIEQGEGQNRSVLCLTLPIQLCEVEPLQYWLAVLGSSTAQHFDCSFQMSSSVRISLEVMSWLVYLNQQSSEDVNLRILQAVSEISRKKLPPLTILLAGKIVVSWKWKLSMCCS